MPSTTTKSMTTLTPKQERFAQLVAQGNSHADAYRNAFNVKPSTKLETSQANGSRMASKSTVKARIAELRSQLSAKALWTREMSVQALLEAYRVAQGTENSGAMTGAIKELNSMHGYNAAQKLEHSGELPFVIQVEFVE